MSRNLDWTYAFGDRPHCRHRKLGHHGPLPTYGGLTISLEASPKLAGLGQKGCSANTLPCKEAEAYPVPPEHPRLRGGRARSQHVSFKVAILERDHHTCQICGCTVGQVCDLHWAPVSQMDVAHIRPYSDCHSTTPDNVRAVCHPCNCRERSGTAGLAVV